VSRQVQNRTSQLFFKVSGAMSSALRLPASKGATVDVSVLNGGRIALPAAFLIHKPVPGHDLFDAPCYSFLVENKKLGKRVLYDLGIMKAWKQKLPHASMCSATNTFITNFEFSS
jgi:hypothetical protein